MDAAFGAHPAVGPTPLDRDGRALDPGLLTLLLVEHVGPEAMQLGPSQVHPEEHLGPVGRLRAARSSADREQSGPVVVLAREEERRPLSAELLLEGSRVAFELGLELGIGSFRDELERRSQIVDPGEELLPGRDLGPQSVRFATDLLGCSLVVPEGGILGQCVELSDALRLGLEVKDAPRSTGSARPDRGWRTRPLSSGPGDPEAGSDGAR